jgi:HEPN domain-containing protein
MKKSTNEWLLSAESDLQLIGLIISQENLTHLAAFHAQQSIEKTFKALIEEFDLGFVKTHSLELLYNKVHAKILLQVDADQLVLLDQLYIEARYPGELGLLPDGKPTIIEATSFYSMARQLFEETRQSLLR